MNRLSKIKYTIKHKRAYLVVEKSILGKNTITGYMHDIDKLLMYLVFGCKLTKIIHRKIARHHSEYLINSHIDYVAMFIDWECARLTKADKQLTGIETLNKYYPELKGAVLHALKEYSVNNKFFDES